MFHPRRHLYTSLKILLLTAVSLLGLRDEVRAQAPISVFEARVMRITGEAQWFSQVRPAATDVKRNDRLSPGDTIQTGRTGLVVIALTDGSQVVILPASRVTFKDFRTAHSIRELLEITLGRIRVRIRHIGNQPNPYLLNSPTASIAVRGTEFLVEVQQSGETLVKVIEGLVEVISATDPDRKRLVAPGRSVIVKPGGEISMTFPGPGSGLNGTPKLTGDVSSAYQDSVNAFVQTSTSPAPALFTAFLDNHLDSRENPAYAGEFTQPEGRVSMVPSISKSARYAEIQSRDASTGRSFRPFDYTLSSQLTFFAPIPNSRFVVGGGIATVRTNLQSTFSFTKPILTGIEEPIPGLPVYTFDFQTSNKSDATNLNATEASLVLARRFGNQGRTSLGVEVERLTGSGAYHGEQSSVDQIGPPEVRNESNVELGRTRVTFGLAHDFSGGRKLGIYYRHGIISVDQRNRLLDQENDIGVFDTPNFDYDSIVSSTRSSEFGVRWRGVITKRFFYGVEGSYLSERIRGHYTLEPGSRDYYLQSVPDGVIKEEDQARRVRVGVGLGYALRLRTVLGFDISGGHYRITSRQSPPVFTYDVSGQGSGSGYFISTHTGLQTALWRGSFASASFLTLHRQDNSSFDSGLTSAYRNDPEAYLKMGVGWRFKPNFTAQYLFPLPGRDYLRSSHSVAVRYTFGLKSSGEN